ncbi:hypothetical protein AB6N16_08065 [Pseudomonas marginalis]
MSGLTVNASALLSTSFVLLQNIDYEKLFEIAKIVKDNDDIAKFGSDPLAYSKAVNGFVPPAGFHMHVVDSNNKYYPSEDDAQSQLSANANTTWTRIEVRAGYSDIACLVCFWCKSGKVM